uniref:Cytochrome b5 heme-binding domain-containing protein n=1 Tax=Hyaloperonospora arabidopsidis (strain Emoy2) TaxID=559515 RepID=M4BH56_HYAAE
MASSEIQDSSQASGSGGDTVIAQYLVTKVAWWATYPRILIVTSSTLSTYDPETFHCTDQWDIADIEAVELSQAKNQFVLQFEKSRFRSAKLKFACSAQGHLLSLLARLRRQAQGKILLYRLLGARRLYFRCIEQFADASNKSLFLQVTVAGIVILNEKGRRLQSLPFLYLRKVAFSTEDEEGMVLTTAFQNRIFLCRERHDCLNEIVAAAKEAGVVLYKTSSDLTALQLRLRNTQVLNRPSFIRFDVKKAKNTECSGDISPDGEESDEAKKRYKEIQLILQGDAVVELHRSMRTVIARPYSALLAIVRPDWDPRMLVLDFKQEDTLVLDVDGRDQLITLLLLVCREASYHNVVLLSSGLNYCRFYHPHAVDTAVRDNGDTAGTLMETFLLTRITQTGLGAEDNNGGRIRVSSVWSPRRRRGGSVTPRASHGNNYTADTDENGRGSWFQRHIRKDRCVTDPIHETRTSMESGLSMNDSVSIVVAMEELNANLLLDELTRSEVKQAEVVNKAMELVFKHLVTLIASLRRYEEITSSELLTTLQALLRLYHHPDACFTNEMVPQVFDAVHELILQQDVLTCYWCLRLLQCFLVVRTPNVSPDTDAAGNQRTKMVQHFVHHETLQLAVVDLVPASFAASNSTSFIANSSTIGAAFWTADSNTGSSTPSSYSSAHSSTLCTKEAQVQNEINVVFYETLLTLHHLVVHMRSAAKKQRAVCDRQNHNQAPTRRKRDLNDVPLTTPSDVLAQKLLEKYQFLMDSIVDVRLGRVAETSVALVKFVLNHFSAKTSAVLLKLPSSDSQLSYLSEKSLDSPKKWLATLRSFLDDYEKVSKSRVEPRSLSFGTQRTIEMPVGVASFGVNECMKASMEKLLNPGTTNGLAAVNSNGSMRLEYLDPNDPSNSPLKERTRAKPSKPRPHQKPIAVQQSKKLLKQPNNIKTGDPFAPRYGQPQRQVVTSPTKSICRGPRAKVVIVKKHAGMVRPRLQAHAAPGMVSPILPIHAAPGMVGPRLPIHAAPGIVGPSLRTHAPPVVRAKRQVVQPPLGSRRTTNKCNACTRCNDVCIDERCFFCADKKYQLKVTYGGPSGAIRSTAQKAARQHRAPSPTDSSSKVEREYSCCETKRHQSTRSCWIRIDDSVYDVTDLLEVHPGGAQVLLEAAQHGGDCGPILKTHPPVAQKMMVQYRLGRYYECSMS